ITRKVIAHPKLNRTPYGLFNQRANGRSAEATAEVGEHPTSARKLSLQSIDLNDWRSDRPLLAIQPSIHSEYQWIKHGLPRTIAAGLIRNQTRRSKSDVKLINLVCFECIRDFYFVIAEIVCGEI